MIEDALGARGADTVSAGVPDSRDGGLAPNVFGSRLTAPKSQQPSCGASLGHIHRMRVGLRAGKPAISARPILRYITSND